jgi:hypothetical protein
MAPQVVTVAMRRIGAKTPMPTNCTLKRPLLTARESFSDM